MIKLRELLGKYENKKIKALFNYIGTERDFIFPMWQIYQCEICAEIWRKDI